MNDEEIKPGHIVMLRSGGPEMTVTDVGLDASDRNSVWVAWFDEKNLPHNGHYPVDAVMRTR